MANCLVVDDSRIVRRLERQILEGLGFDVSEAGDGLQALNYCREHIPALILLDWHMPHMDGLAFLKAFRAMPQGQQVKVIFCTTESDPARIVEALGCGADEYVMKPFDADIIKIKLQQLGLL
jgi:two-component system, chemotaxis family, chemotaxis protein CheY